MEDLGAYTDESSQHGKVTDDNDLKTEVEYEQLADPSKRTVTESGSSAHQCQTPLELEEVRLLYCMQYPLFERSSKDDVWFEHTRAIQVGLLPVEACSERFEVAVKIVCTSNSCPYSELIFSEDLWDKLRDIRVELKLKNFIYDTPQIPKFTQKKMNLNVNGDLQLRLRSNHYGLTNGITIDYLGKYISLHELEFERLFTLAPLINHHRRCLKYMKFAHFYAQCVDVVADGLKKERKYNKKSIKEDVILFTAEMLSINSILRSGSGSASQHGQCHQSLIEILKFYPQHFIRDVETMLSLDTESSSSSQYQNEVFV